MEGAQSQHKMLKIWLWTPFVEHFLTHFCPVKNSQNGPHLLFIYLNVATPYILQLWLSFLEPEQKLYMSEGIAPL